MDWLERRRALATLPHHAATPPPPAPAHPSDSGQDSDDDQQDAPPPHELLISARTLIPSLTRRDIFSAWDRTRGIGTGQTTGKGEEYGPDSTRWQAAVGFLLDDAAKVEQEEKERKREVKGKGKEKVVQIDEDDDDDEVQLDEPGGQVDKTRRDASWTKQPLFRRSPSYSTVELSSSSDTEEDQEVEESLVVGSSSGRPPKKKAKLDDIRSSPAIKPKRKKMEVIELSDSDDDDVGQPKVRPIATQPREGRRRSLKPYDLADSDDDPALNPNPFDVEIEVYSPPPQAHPRLANANDDLTLSSDEDEDIMILDAVPAPPQQQPPPPAPFQILTTILSILPDVDPSPVLTLAEELGTADAVMERLLSMDGGYPKLVVEDDEEVEKEVKEKEVDWLDKEERETPDVQYKRAALDQLNLDFDTVAVGDIKTVFKDESNFFYAPAWLSLRAKKKSNSLNLLIKPRPHPADKMAAAKKKKKKKQKIHDKLKGKGKQRARDSDSEEEEEEEEEEWKRPYHPELEKEIQWLSERVYKERQERKRLARIAEEEKEKKEREEKADEKAKRKGKAVECGCCYGEFAGENLVSCDSGCLFCKECAAGNAKERLGQRLHTLPCLLDCGTEFPPSQVRLFLDEKSLELWEKVRMEKEVEMAGLEGLESCPFCPYAAVMENPDERLFTCEREGCRQVSCRKCRKPGHVPLSCSEAEEDQKRPAIHQVEEAMSEALIRRCPKCQQPYVKSDGCNLIRCTSCGTQSCYICNKIINGHSHFHEAAGRATKNQPCILFDDTEQRTFQEVEDARQKAVGAQQLDAQQQARIEKLKADAPVRGAPILPHPHAGAGGLHPGMGGAGWGGPFPWAQMWGVGGGVGAGGGAGGIIFNNAPGGVFGAWGNVGAGPPPPPPPQHAVPPPPQPAHHGPNPFAGYPHYQPYPPPPPPPVAHHPHHHHHHQAPPPPQHVRWDDDGEVQVIAPGGGSGGARGRALGGGGPGPQADDARRRDAAAAAAARRAREERRAKRKRGEW